LNEGKLSLAEAKFEKGTCLPWLDEALEDERRTSIQREKVLQRILVGSFQEMTLINGCQIKMHTGNSSFNTTLIQSKTRKFFPFFFERKHSQKETEKSRKSLSSFPSKLHQTFDAIEGTSPQIPYLN
jgi:hypothetical protein